MGEHVRRIFVSPTKRFPMEFYFFPLEESLANVSFITQERQEVTELVQARGGVVVEKQGDFTIPLGHALFRESYPCFQEVYSVQFIVDCIANSVILKLDQYRLNRLVMYGDDFNPNAVLERKQEWVFWLDAPPDTFVPRPFKLTHERMAPMNFLIQQLPLRVPQTELDALKEEIRTLACKIDTACGRVCSRVDDYTIRIGFDYLKHYYPQDVEIFSHTYIDDVLKKEGFPKLADYRLFESIYDDDCNPDEVLWQRKKWSDYKLKTAKRIPSQELFPEISEAPPTPPTEGAPGRSSPPMEIFEPEVEAIEEGPNRTLGVAPKMERLLVTPKKERQPDFGSLEQVAILKYIVDKNAYGRVGGNSLWQEMERDGVCPGRTFHSLRNHYVKKLQHLLHTFGKLLTSKQIEHFRRKKPIKDELKSSPASRMECSKRKRENLVEERQPSQDAAASSATPDFLASSPEDVSETSTRAARCDKQERRTKRKRLPGRAVHPAFQYGTSSSESS